MYLNMMEGLKKLTNVTPTSASPEINHFPKHNILNQSAHIQLSGRFENLETNAAENSATWEEMGASSMKQQQRLQHIIL